jgi:arsenate reductase
VNLQLFGTKKCPDTRKAERFFKDRGVKFQYVDLAQKGMSAGELRSVAAGVGSGGVEKLIDRDGKRYLEKGLKYAAPTGPRIEKILVDDPLLLKTPIVRDGPRATVGFAPDVWQTWLDEARR